MSDNNSQESSDQQPAFLPSPHQLSYNACVHADHSTSTPGGLSQSMNNVYNGVDPCHSNNANEGEENDDVVTVLPSLHGVFKFKCSHVELCIVSGKPGWKCLWCDRSFTPLHATRALTHLVKKKGYRVFNLARLISPQNFWSDMNMKCCIRH